MTTDNTKIPGQPVCGDSDCNSCERWPVASSPAMNAASPTELSKRLRDYANQSWKFSNINVAKNDLLALLDELDRLAAPVGQGSAPACPNCGGSGEITVLEGSGPDTYEMPANCLPCAGTGAINQGSATSGEAVATYHQRIAADPNFNGVRSKEHMFDYVLAEVGDLRAALAAKAEQANSAVLSDKQTQALTLAAATFDAFDIAGADDLRSIIKSSPVTERAAAPDDYQRGIAEGMKRERARWVNAPKLSAELHCAAAPALSRQLTHQIGGQAAPAELTDDQIEPEAKKYALFVRPNGDDVPGYYDVTKYECREDFFNCVRACIRLAAQAAQKGPAP